MSGYKHIVEKLARSAQPDELLPQTTLVARIKALTLTPSKTRSQAWIKEFLRELKRVGFLKLVHRRHQRLYRLHMEKSHEAHDHFLRLDQSRRAGHRLPGLEVYRRMGNRPTFTRAQLNEAFPELGLLAIDQMVSRLGKRGVLIRVTGSRGRGRYEIVPERWTRSAVEKREKEHTTPPVDRLTAALTFGGEAAIFCYTTAMELHRLCRYDVLSVVYLSGGRRFRKLEARDIEYVWTKRPEPDLGSMVHDYRGFPVRVSNVERTLIDMLHRPKYCLEVEDILRAIELIEFVDVNKVLQYLHTLKLAPLFAKVGYFLDRNRKRWKIPATVLKALRNTLPPKPVYLFLQRPSRLVPDWNVRIPEELLE